MELFSYTGRHPTDGNIGIGKLSSHILPEKSIPDKFISPTGFHMLNQLENIATEYLSLVPDVSATTHHTYYTDLSASSSIKANFERIQNSEFWQGLRQGAFDDPQSFAMILRNMVEMNEIYYSNPKPNFVAGPLYGAAANLIPHRDCILFYFPGIRVYRVIIGATDGNHDTVTEFITHGVERRLNKGDYMVFDFDRTLHQVRKTGNTPTPRVLLKLHFLVCDKQYVNLPFLWIYVKFAYWCYVAYYRVARYTEQLGTDPKTFVGFFFGILWEYPFYPKVRYSVASTYLGVVSCLQITHGIQFGFSNITSIHGATSVVTSYYPQIIRRLMRIIREVVVYSALDMFLIYLCVVGIFYGMHLYSESIRRN